MHTKKDNRPKRIKNELNRKDTNHGAKFGRSPYFIENPPAGRGHNQIEDRPDGTKQPIGWIKKGLVQRLIPTWNIRDGRGATNKSRCENGY